MGEQLQINELEIEKFGRLENKKIPIESKGLTVIFGENEMGKSTAADLIIYLLTGKGLRTDINRFGSRNDPIKGKIRGSFQGEQFSIERTAKVGATSPISEEFSIKIGSQDLSDEVWHARLRYNEDIFENTYRLRGETLFNDKQIINTMIDALASGTDEFNIPQAKSEVNNKAKGALSSKAQGSESYIKIGTKLNKVNTEIRELKETRGECVTLDGIKDELEEKIRELTNSSDRLDEQIQVAKEIIRNQEENEKKIVDLEEAIKELRKGTAAKETLYNESLSAVQNIGLSANHLLEKFSIENQNLFDLRTTWATEYNNLESLQLALDVTEDSVTSAKANVVSAKAAWKNTTNTDYKDWNQNLSQQTPSISTQETDIPLANKDPRFTIAGAVVTFVLAVISALVMNSPIDWVAATIFAAIGSLTLRSTLKGQTNLDKGDFTLDETQSETVAKLASMYSDIIDAERNQTEKTGYFEKEKLAFDRQAKKVSELKEKTRNLAEEKGIDTPDDADPSECQHIFELAKKLLQNHLELEKSKKAFHQESTNLRELKNEENELKSRKEELILTWTGPDEDFSHQSLSDILNSKTQKHQTLETELTTKNQELGALGNELDSLRKQEKWQELDDLRSTLEEKRKQQLLEGAAYAIAESLLSEVEEEFIKNNQPALLRKANKYFCSFTSDRREIFRGLGQNSELQVRYPNAGDLKLDQLSTGARCSLYFALRLAKASVDAEKGQVFLPFVCDDPLVHVDDQRIGQIIPALQEGPASERQIILFTCHRRVLDLAEEAGASTVNLEEIFSEG